MTYGKKRIEEVDILRGIAAALMILGHSFIVYPIDVSNVSWCVALSHFVYTFHMELFFVLAGVVYHCSNYKEFYYKKFRRIMVPYLFFGTMALLMRAFGGAAVNGVEPVGFGVYKLLFHGGGYWFLYVLFLIYAIYPWLDKFCPGIWIKLSLMAILLIIKEFAELPSFLAIRTVVSYLPYFLLGHCLAKLQGGFPKKMAQVAVAGISVLLFAVLDWFEILGGRELGATMSFVRAIAIMVFLYILVRALMPLWHKSLPCKALHLFLTDCGKYSLQLYLFNGYLLVIFRIFICQVLNITEPVIIVLGIWIGNLAVTLVACKWIIPKIPLFRTLCGL